MDFGFIENFKKKPAQEETYSDGYDDDYYGEFSGYDDPVADDGSQGMQPQSVGMNPVGTGMGGISLSGASIEMKVLKPKTFESVPQIADHLLNRRTVVLNLEASNKEISRRIIDFLSGVAYALDGRLSNVAVNTYLITPSHVSVSGEDLSAGRDKEEKEPLDYPED